MNELINPLTGRPFVKDFFKKYAWGKPCQVRIASSCGYQCTSPDTTVLCHITLPGLKAMGKKLIPDLLGSWGCSCCHDLADRRILKPLPYSLMAELDAPIYKLQMDNALHEGMARTIDELIRAGILPNPV